MDTATFPEAVLGQGLPAEAERHLRQAGLAYVHDEIAEQHLREAREIAPAHVAVSIAFYRFYFYKGRLAEALQIAQACLARAGDELGLAADWRAVRCGDAEFDRYDAVLPRFFLFTLKGYAYLQMRLGNVAEGREAVMKVLELDRSDKLGAKVLLGVLERMGKADDD